MTKFLGMLLCYFTFLCYKLEYQYQRTSILNFVTVSTFQNHHHLSVCITLRISNENFSLLLTISSFPLRGQRIPWFAATFKRICKIAKVTELRHVRPSVHIEQLGPNWTYLKKKMYLRIFRKSVDKVQVSLKSDKNNWYFTWRSLYILYRISLSSSYNETYFRENYKENQNAHFMFNITARLYIYIQGVTGGRDQTSGGCSLCETIPKKPKTPISKVERFGR